MEQHYKPGQTVQMSGIYKIVKDGTANSGFEVICLVGDYFLPLRTGESAHYELLRAITHAHEHAELGCGDLAGRDT